MNRDEVRELLKSEDILNELSEEVRILLKKDEEKFPYDYTSGTIHFSCIVQATATSTSSTTTTSRCKPGMMRLKCMCYSLLSLFVVLSQVFVLYYLILEGSHPTCSRHEDCQFGEFCSTSFNQTSIKSLKLTPRCFDCSLKEEEYDDADSNKTLLSDLTRCENQTNYQNIYENSVVWVSFDGVYHPKSLDEDAIHCLELKHCAESNIGYNQNGFDDEYSRNHCDFLELNLTQVSRSTWVIFCLVAVIFAVTIHKDIKECVFEEKLLDFGSKPDESGYDTITTTATNETTTATNETLSAASDGENEENQGVIRPEPWGEHENHYFSLRKYFRSIDLAALVDKHMPPLAVEKFFDIQTVEIFKIGLRIRRFVLPWIITGAISTVILREIISVKNILLNLLAIGFISEADNLLGSMWTLPSHKDQESSFFEKAKKDKDVTSSTSYEHFMIILGAIVPVIVMVVGVFHIKTALSIFNQGSKNCDEIHEVIGWTSFYYFPLACIALNCIYCFLMLVRENKFDLNESIPIIHDVSRNYNALFIIALSWAVADWRTWRKRIYLPWMIANTLIVMINFIFFLSFFQPFATEPRYGIPLSVSYAVFIAGVCAFQAIKEVYLAENLMSDPDGFY